MLEKPSSITKSPFRSKKWDELVNGRDFQPSHAPILATLCYWYEVLETCMNDLDIGGEIQVAYSNDMGDVKELPQVGTMKKASAEIRALSKQLDINDDIKEEKPKETKLYVFQEKRKSKAKNQARASA